MSVIQAIILGIIEGLTEFLPVSSTGHLILSATIMNVEGNEFVKSFEIAIQLGAILSVVFIYYQRFLVSLDIYKKLTFAFLPTGIIGFVAYSTIKAYLFNPITVSIALILGGVALILLDKQSDRKELVYTSTDEISYSNAFKIGLIQCISMIPGVSRAAATIFGGVFVGFSRKQAAEFSFLLAIPTMLAATGYDLIKTGVNFSTEEWQLLLIGTIISFIMAFIAIKAFIAFLTKNGFKLFGFYRIIVGIVFLWLYFWFGDNFKM